MTFTIRFLILVAVGVVPLLLSSLFAPFALVGVLWNVLLVILATVDYLRCPRPSDAVAVQRVTDNALSVATANSVAVRVRNQSAETLKITVRDEPPTEFGLEADGDSGTRQKRLVLKPFEQQSFSYSVVPLARGDFGFGDVYVRLTAPLGLVVRQSRVAAAQGISVFPNLRAVGEYEMLLRRNTRVRQGNRRMRISGGGREFASLRDYAPDDEYRTIDWSATARTGKVISRTYEAERSQDILLLIDEGRLMRQEVGSSQKLDHVVNAALMLAHVAGEADDNVGLLTFAEETRVWIPPHRGRAQSSAILQALYAARAMPVESDYRAAFRYIATRWRKRSLAVLFTDLSDPESSAVLLTEITQLARTHLVCCVVVSDPLLGERVRQMPDTLRQVYEKAVAEEAQTERQRALALLEKRGVLVVDAEPQELSLELISRYLSVKSRSLF